METRLGPRIKINLKVISRIDEDQKLTLLDGDSFEAAGYDISIGGIGILTRIFLPKKLIINLEIEGAPFGLGESMKIKGEISHCNYIKPHEYKSGIKFLDIADKYKKAIADFISTYEKRKETRIKLSEK